MDEAAARARLERMTQANAAPTLEDSEVAELLELARRPDASGRRPSEDGWAPTFDLHAAAAEGWRWKAAKVATDTAFSADGSTFQRDQAHKGALAMAAAEERQAGPAYDPDAPDELGAGDLGTIRLSPPSEGDPAAYGSRSRLERLLVNAPEAP